MRELFDEVAGKSPLDPEEAVRRTTRAPQRKRFYASAGVAEAAGGFAITLDGKPIRTPSRPPGRGAEPGDRRGDRRGMESTEEIIDPLTMPLTRFANSVVDAVVDRVEAVADDVAKYLGPICCSIAPAIPRRWSRGRPRIGIPCCSGPRMTLGAHFILAEGIVHVRQPESAIAAARAALPGDPWSIAALHVVTTLTGSALLALALLHGVLDRRSGLGRRPCR